MANRFWVGGSGTWDASSTTHWSASDGGASGASAPTALDAAIINGNSGGGTVTLNGFPVCLSLATTGFAGTLAFGSVSLSVSGSVTIGAVTTVTASTGIFSILGTCAFTSNAVSVPCALQITGVALTFQDNTTFTTSNGTITNSAGTVDLNGKTITAASFTLTGAGTLTFGAGSLVLSTGIDIAGAATINANTGTIKLTGTMTCQFGNLTYNNLWLHGTGSSIFTLGAGGGTGTFNDLKADVGGDTISFPPATTTTVSSLTIGGSAGSLITLKSNSTPSTWTISDGAGTNSVTYCSITDSIATGGAAFHALNSTNGGNNTGWIFDTAAMFMHGLPFA